jgi:hypothetical protein
MKSLYTMALVLIVLVGSAAQAATVVNPGTSGTCPSPSDVQPNWEIRTTTDPTGDWQAEPRPFDLKMGTALGKKLTGCSTSKESSTSQRNRIHCSYYLDPAKKGPATVELGLEKPKNYDCTCTSAGKYTCIIR